MKDDYLWDREGTPDPSVEALEALLAPLSWEAERPRRRLRWKRWAAAAALLFVTLTTAMISFDGGGQAPLPPEPDPVVTVPLDRLQYRVLEMEGRVTPMETKSARPAAKIAVGGHYPVEQGVMLAAGARLTLAAGDAVRLEVDGGEGGALLFLTEA